MSLGLKNVSYTYDASTPFEKRALDGVSFSIADGSFFGIAGDSGSGKTSLVRILKGLIEPSDGEVSIPEGCRVGLAFQYPESQLFEQTVLKDVMFGPLNMGLGEEKAKCLATKALSEVGLDPSYFDRDPLALSGGEKRRVAIAGVLSMEPDVIILDEPAAGLDPAMHDLVFSLLGGLNGKGRTIVMVSHSMDDIARYCDHVVYLKDGCVVAEGTPEQVFSNGEVTSSIPKPLAASLADRLRDAGLPIPAGVCRLDDLEDAIASAL